jgi:hypothetical protein
MNSSSNILDSIEDDSNSIAGLKRRRNDEEQQRKFTRLLTDLSRSFDSMNDYYEIRQIQQQFSIELPLPQPPNRHKLPYGKKKRFSFLFKS